MNYEEELYDQVHRSEIWKRYKKAQVRRSKLNVFYLVSLSSFLVLVVFIVGIFIFVFLFLQKVWTSF